MSPDAPQLQQKLSAFSSRAGDVAPKCNSEATTKNFLIAPYLHEVLGYNPFNPDHCVPEYSADIKGAGDKVDYALLHTGQPIIIVEAKSIGTIQNKPRHTRTIERLLRRMRSPICCTHRRFDLELVPRQAQPLRTRRCAIPLPRRAHPKPRRGPLAAQHSQPTRLRLRSSPRTGRLCENEKCIPDVASPHT